MVNTGPGKGKTTAALGAALRAAGNGWQVLIIQFIKNRMTGEMAALDHIPQVTIRRLGLGMIRGGRISEADRSAAGHAWETCLQAAHSGQYGLIILDEICPALKYGLIDAKDVLDFLTGRPDNLYLILTGRDCPEDLLRLADTVTIMDNHRHHLASNVKAQPGIEY
jgi:cob(I)alamin adenosyltransferase